MVDKPAGPTSHDIVQRVRRAYRTRAVGHTGTLDPFATGLMVALLGRATRLARFVERERKTYLATARLGVATATDDLTGETLATADPAAVAAVTRAQVESALAALTGDRMQRPPAFSAKHVEGRRSYALARAGQVVVLPEAAVTVHSAEVIAWEAPELIFRASVSAGTYIRALARDLGEALGVGAHLTALRRESIGSLHVDAAVPAGQLDGSAPLLPPLAVLSGFPRVELDESGANDVRHGRSIPAPLLPTQGPVALTTGGALLAVAEARDGRLQPVVVLESA